MDPITCPEGKFTLLLSATILEDCKDCPAGWYCSADATLGIKMTKCPAGVLCTGGAKTAAGNAICPIGYYCPIGSSSGIPCPPGKYCDITGMKDPSEAKPCDAGYWCKIGSNIPNPTDDVKGRICDRGYYCPSGTVAPIACPIGKYNPLPGQQDISKCLACKDG